MSTSPLAKRQVSCRRPSHRVEVYGASWGLSPPPSIRWSPAVGRWVQRTRLKPWRTSEVEPSRWESTSHWPEGGQDGGWVTDYWFCQDILWWQRCFHWLETTWGEWHPFICFEKSFSFIPVKPKKKKKKKNDSENFEFLPEDTAVVTVRDGRIWLLWIYGPVWSDGNFRIHQWRRYICYNNVTQRNHSCDISYIEKRCENHNIKKN